MQMANMTIRGFKYTIVFTYAIRAIQEQDEVAKQQQAQIDGQLQQTDKLIPIILHACILTISATCC